MTSTLRELLTIVVPTRNRLGDMQNFLQHSLTLMPGVSHILYDDASDEANRLRRLGNVHPHVNIIEGDKRVGPSVARNILAATVETPFILFMDDDCALDDFIHLETLVRTDLEYDELGKVDAVQFQVIRHYDKLSAYQEFDEPRRGVLPLGMGCLFRTSSFRRIGGFRDCWTYRHEETDLGYRMWSKGQILVIDPRTVVTHYHSSAARSSPEYCWNSARNTFLLDSLNIAAPFGPVIGAARTLRYVVQHSQHKIHALAGAVAGCGVFLRNILRRTPMPFGEYLKLRKLVAATNNHADPRSRPRLNPR